MGLKSGSQLLLTRTKNPSIRSDRRLMVLHAVTSTPTKLNLRWGVQIWPPIQYDSYLFAQYTHTLLYNSHHIHSNGVTFKSWTNAKLALAIVTTSHTLSNAIWLMSQHRIFWFCSLPASLAYLKNGQTPNRNMNTYYYTSKHKTHPHQPHAVV